MTESALKLLSSMVGAGVGLGADTVSGTEGLTPREAEAVSRAVPKRVAEFAAGRRAARNALSQIGIADAELPVGSDRAPVWPMGTTGSITHDTGLALAAAVLLREAGSIGIDITEAVPLPADVRDQILRHPHEASLDDLEARAAFSAKETLFKALSPHVGFVFGFSAAVVHVDMNAGLFEAHILHDLGPFEKGRFWEGRIGIEGNRLMTALVLPHASGQ